MPENLLQELQKTIHREIPLCAHMGIQVHAYDGNGLTLCVPLKPNHNHQNTAFAGSLNALCTVAGWGTVFMMTRRHNLSGDIVIRRSDIRYLRPVDSPNVFASCSHVEPQKQEHFLEMLREKSQAKIDLHVEIFSHGEASVSFQGSYVVLDRKIL